MALEVVFANASQIALTVTLVCAFIAFLKILVDPTSPFLKRRHLERIRYSLFLGVALGLVFSLLGQYSQYFTLGLSFVLLSFTLYYYFLRRTPTIFYGLRLPWVSRETAQARFFHFSMATAMATFIIFFFYLGVIEAPSGIPVPLLTLTLLLFSSAVSAIFALTIFVPKLDLVFRLIDDYVQAAHHPMEGMGVDLEDSDFHVMIADTAFTPAEVVDAFESLRSEGYADRQPNPILGHARYRILPDGIIFLDAAAQDVKGRIDSAIRESNIAIDSIDSRVNGARAVDSPALKEAVKQLQTLGIKMTRLKEEYGRLLPGEWEAAASRRIHDLVTGIHEQLVGSGSQEGADARDVQKEGEREAILKELPQEVQEARRPKVQEEEGAEGQEIEEEPGVEEDIEETEEIQRPEETRGEEMLEEPSTREDAEDTVTREDLPEYEVPGEEAPPEPGIGDGVEETDKILQPRETRKEPQLNPAVGDAMDDTKEVQEPTSDEDDSWKDETSKPSWRYHRKNRR